jgi:hypothetical protein
MRRPSGPWFRDTGIEAGGRLAPGRVGANQMKAILTPTAPGTITGNDGTTPVAWIDVLD